MSYNGNGSEKHGITLAQSVTLVQSDTLAQSVTLARNVTLAPSDFFAMLHFA